MNVQPVVSTDPVYGRNYKLGDTFLTYHDSSFVSYGIAWFSRPAWNIWPPDVRVSHAGIVAGPDNTVEALPNGVVQSDLHKYFVDPTCHIYFRRLRDWCPLLGQRIVLAANRRLGQKYGYGTIVSDMLANTLLGRFLNRVCCRAPDKFVSKLLGSPNRPVCSVLVAEAHQDQPCLNGLGVFANPARLVKPQDLADDEVAYLPLS